MEFSGCPEGWHGMGGQGLAFLGQGLGSRGFAAAWGGNLAGCVEHPSKKGCPQIPALCHLAAPLGTWGIQEQ